MRKAGAGQSAPAIRVRLINHGGFRMKKSLLLIITLCALAACSSNLQLYNQSGKQLQSGNGWLALMTDAPGHYVELEFDSGASSFVAPPLPPGRSFAIVQLPAGEYVIGTMHLNTTRYYWKGSDSEQGTRFTIKPESINYFGEITVNTTEKYNEKEGLFIMDSAKLMRTLNEYYPELSDLNVNYTELKLTAQ